MESNMIWSYLIHLSSNMWGDPGSKETFAPYHDSVLTDDAVWKQTIDFLPAHGINTVLIDVGDAVEYESHPEISIPGAWSRDKLKRELDRIRALGMTPIPKLNFGAAHDAWLGKYARMLSTPAYYEVCRDLIHETAELFDHPRYFHLGMDEENYQNQALYQMCCIRNGDLWWHDAYFLFDCCREEGARPWVWADRYWDFPEEYLQRMPKSVLQSNWFYAPVRRKPDGSLAQKEYAAYLELDAAGFDQVPTSSTWSCWYNSQQTMEIGRSGIAPERLKGYMTAPWEFTVPSAIYALLNDAQRFGDAKKKVYPELA